MRNRHRVFCFFVFFLSISLFLFPTFALCYNTNKGGHREFSDKAIQLKKTKDPQLKKQLDLNEKTIKDATAAEDSPFTKTRKHFYNPATGKGLLYYFKNAKERAEKFYTSAVNSYCSGNKQKGWDLLGHALHLLQDMGSPPHVYNATHAFQKFKQTWGYENYVSNNWPELEKQIVAEDCELSGGIDHYIHEMALYTYSHYPKHDWELLIYA